MRPRAEQRLTYAVARPSGHLLREPPGELTASITSVDTGETWTSSAPRHGSSRTAHYYPLSFTPPRAGQFEIEGRVDGQRASARLVVAEDTDVPQVGDAFPVVATATTRTPEGVSPLCSLEPPCHFHDRSVADVLAAGAPTVILVASPGYCLSDLCWDPVTLLIEAEELIPAPAVAIHVEVYVNPDDVPSVTFAQPTELVTTTGLIYEPWLFVVDDCGRVTARLDSLFDRTELGAALATLEP